ncbi:hypothetical protein PV04_01863 [Phialophora macrospora]|uniref:Clr5 domain-containing protein n=1 Tax=Phialophora macrospora TaxID=1851006 RepID=A0A0D2G4N9_9EURO|nr:hypothetical protein PV04_01863 [Phialophora macrospora]
MPTTDPPRRRKKAPSEAEWNRIRPAFERLYIRERQTLPRISAILAKDHNFHAAPCMYKHRISKWGLKKNFRLEELEAVASTLGHFVQAGLNPPNAIIDNREVPIERAKRHFKASFRCEDQLPSGGTMVRPKESFRQNCRAVCAKRTTQTKLGLQQRSQTVPRVLLQQSAESHLLESTLAAVNNYFAWRLSQSDEYFAVPKHGDGEHTVFSDEIDPTDTFLLMEDGIRAALAGAYQVSQSVIRRFCVQARVLLLQQHPSLLENLVYTFRNGFRGLARQIQSSISSYLAALAKRLFEHGHPVLMILKLLNCYEGQGKGFQLVWKLMCEIATRQKDPNAQIIFDLDYNMALASVENDDLHTAAGFCQALLQRYMDRLDERHEFCRILLRLLGQLYYRYDLNDKAEQVLLRVLELDDFYARDARNADWISLSAIRCLGAICEETEDLSGAVKWYSQAYEAACYSYGVEDGTTQASLHKLKSVQRRLGETDDVLGEDQIDEADILEEIRIRTAQLALEGFSAEAGLEATAGPWNEWQADILDANDSTRPSRSGRANEDGISDTSQQVGSHQSSPRTESKGVGNDILLGGESAWHAANASGQEHEKEHSLESSIQCLQDPAHGTAFDTLNEVDVAFDLSYCSAADPSISTMEPPFTASEIASDALHTHSLSSNAQDATTAEQYIDLLPSLENGLEFDEFDHVKASNMTESNLMIRDTDGNANVSNPGFFDCSDLQDWHALDGHDAVHNQDPDIDWGDLMTFE